MAHVNTDLNSLMAHVNTETLRQSVDVKETLFWNTHAEAVGWAFDLRMKFWQSPLTWSAIAMALPEQFLSSKSIFTLSRGATNVRDTTADIAPANRSFRFL